MTRSLAANEKTGQTGVEFRLGRKRGSSLCARLFTYLLAGSLVSMIAAPIAAQRTTFNPYVSVGLFATTNVDFVGEDGRADAGFRLGLTLPVDRALKRGTLSFGYAVFLNSYRDFTSLDNISHRVFLNLDTHPSRQSTFSVRTTYIVTQRQGDTESADPADLFLVQRTNRQRASLDLGYRGRVYRRWEWGVSVGGAQWRFTQIEDFDSSEPQVPLEDRSALRGWLELTHTVSPFASFGVRYGYRLFDLEVSGEETSHLVSFVYRREIVDRLSLQLTFGGFVSTGEAAAGSAGSPDDRRSGAQGTLRLTRSFRRSSLSIFAGHIPTSGGARIGTSTNSYVGLSYGNRTSRNWIWGLHTRVARRDPSDPERATIHSLSAGFSINRRLSHLMGIRFRSTYVRQIGDAAVSEGLYLRGGLGLVWYPLGRGR